MSTLTRYLLREFTLASAAVFAALIVTWAAADAMLHIDELGDSLARAARGMGARALEVAPLGVPIACTAGIVWSMSQAVKGREITAIRCGGIPLRRALLPVLGASLAIAIALSFFQDRLLVPTRQAMHEADSRTNGSRALPQRVNGRWWYASGESVFSALEFDAATGQLFDVTVFEYDARRTIRRRIESEVAMSRGGEVWEFLDADVYEFDGPDVISQSRVEKLRLELGVSGADLERARRPPALETLNGLARAIARSTDASGRVARQVAFHSRLAAPLAVLILVALAIPIAVGDVERGDSLPRALVTAIGVAAVYYVAWTLALRTAGSGTVPPFAPIWGVALVALGAGGWRYARLKE